MIGRRIGGRYEILSRLGEGGMALVYKAKDLILDRLVSVKILRTDLAGDEEFVKRFHREAESVASLSHPNIVAIYDIGEEDDIYYIVMEYVHGMSLKEFIKDYSPLTISEAVHIMKQIDAAIAHAHAHGIIHRDIKPHNILIDESEHVKVTDFGIAMAVSSATITFTHSIMGSAHYLSPEQARGGKATIKSDIYSLGIVMFELLTSRVPFPGTSPVSVALKQLKDPIPFPRDFRPEIPQSLENVVLRALAKDPDDRYASVADMSADLATALSPERSEEPRVIFADAGDEESDAEKTIKMTPLTADDDSVPASDPAKKTIAPAKGKDKKKRSWVKRLLTTLAILTLLIAAGIVIGLVILPKVFYVENVQVPRVVGMKYDKANALMQDHQLKVKRVEQASKNVQKNAVINQNPKAGTEVKAGSQIILFVSTGQSTIKVDNYIGYDRDSLLNTLPDEGYKRVAWHEVDSSSIPEGQVISQSPAAGKRVIPSKTVLNLTYSGGQPQVTVPDLSGKTKSEVKQMLKAAGLSPEYMPGDYSDSVTKGELVSQEPAAGKQVAKGTEIVVSFSKGQKQTTEEVDQPIKVVYNGTDSDSSSSDASSPQPSHVQIYYTDATHHDSLFADEEITATKTYTIPFQLAPGTSGSYRIIIDGNQEKTGTVDYPD
ncbi:MAG: Stk1 family PASTA domain-containing Ser/Thr kinase [Sporolactobacillus sp.]